MDKQIFLGGMISAPENEAHRLAKALVEKKLVACAQVTGAVTSYFWWEGKVEKEPEVLIFFKTIEERAGEVVRFVEENHSYDVPECVMFPITAGATQYLDWINQSVRS